MEKTITKKDIADFLRDKRAECKMRVPEVTQRLKSMYGLTLSDKTLYGYESEVSSPNIPLFLALCKIYGVEDILGEIERAKKTRVALERDETILIDYYRSATREAQELVLKMLKPDQEDTTFKVG